MAGWSKRRNRSHAAPANQKLMPNQSFPIIGKDLSGDLTRPEATMSMMYSSIGEQKEGQTQILNRLDNLQGTINHEVASSSSAQRSVIVRYSLKTDADIDKIKEMGQGQIDVCFKREGGVWKNVVSNTLEKRVLQLRLRSPEYEEEVRQTKSETANILGLSGHCEVRWDQYLVMTRYFKFDKSSMPNPDQHISDWSWNNGVKIVRAYWKNPQLVLALASLEDAMSLVAEGRKVCLNGQEGKAT